MFVSPVTPHFQGVTRELRGRRVVSEKNTTPHIPTGQDLRDRLEKSSSPYIGTLPRVWVDAFKPDPKQAFALMDRLSEMLREGRCLQQGQELRLGASQGHLRVTLSPVKGGAFGMVYRVEVNGAPFALKVYKERQNDHQLNGHGRFNEAATGLFFSKWQMKDLARFFFGNPAAGWSVMEFIGSEDRVNDRSGKRLTDFPIAQGDDGEGKNRLNGVRVDYGGLVETVPPADAQQALEVCSLSEFMSGLQDPETRMLTLQQNLPALAAYQEKEQRQVLDAVLDYPECRVAAVQQFQHLPVASKFHFYKGAMAYPECRVSLAPLIRQLQPDEKLPAFEIAMKHPECRVAVTGYMGALMEPDRMRAWKMTMDYPECRIAATSYIQNLPEKVRFQAFNKAMAYPECRTTAVNQIGKLPENDRRAALEAALQYLECKASLLQQLLMLPQDVRKELFDAALMDEKYRLSAAQQLPHLGEEDQLASFKAVLQYPDMYPVAVGQLPQMSRNVQKEAFDDALAIVPFDIIRQALGHANGRLLPEISSVLSSMLVKEQLGAGLGDLIESAEVVPVSKQGVEVLGLKLPQVGGRRD